MTYLGRPVSSGSTAVWDGDSFIFKTAPIAPKYPDAASAVLAWDFNTTGLPIPNLGTAGSGADLVVAANTPIYNIPGPVNSGVQFSSISTVTPTIQTAQGPSANLGSSAFTTAMTIVAFFDVSVIEPLQNGGGTIFHKHWRPTTTTWAPPYASAGFEVANNNIAGFINSIVYSPYGLGTLGSSYRTGYHMCGLTFEGGVALRVYWDGLQVAQNLAGIPGSLNFANPDGNGEGQGEGPWVFGAVPNINQSPAGFPYCWDNRMYAFRAYNTLKDAEWMRQAWKDANGWP